MSTTNAQSASSPKAQEAVKDRQVNITSDQIHALALTTINVSHYNEKVRWALDYYRVEYTEYRTLPLLHILAMFNSRYRGHGAISPGVENTPFMTPHLKVQLKPGSNNKYQIVSLINSSSINEFVSSQYSSANNIRSLYCNDDEAAHRKIVELEERLDNVLGVHVRRYLYGELMLYAPSSVMRDLGRHDSYGKVQKWLWLFLNPVIRAALTKIFELTPANVQKSRDIVEKEFEHFSQLLMESSVSAADNSGHSYLVGNQFSAADLALAALGCMPLGLGQDDGYGAWVPPEEVLRPEAQALAKKLRATPAGQHIVKCYKLHRGRRASRSSYGYSLFGLW